ncbi:hypothetical protein J2Z66_000555 [Paenibacillus eucommiae]|uniref:Uncharacterized protein n=1 Tax=Paenibacillus eucommiae TaxID=1355755 RepID=A0ABS4IP62_9BACL|nr:hypothetical protein [Paenibacillus eucommiae]
MILSSHRLPRIEIVLDLTMFFIVKVGCGDDQLLLAMKNIVKVADSFSDLDLKRSR